MSTDKRSVSTDALETLGTIIDDKQKRDAIHLAVLPMVAAVSLHVGEHVDKDGNPAVAYSRTAVGIVDPFIDATRVNQGERFWLVIYPRVITSLRHVWSHPAFSDEPVIDAPVAGSMLAKAASEKWLRDFVSGSDCPDYETVIATAIAGDSWDDDYLHFSGFDAHGEIPPEFWNHVEIVTGKTIANRASYFSCSC